MANFEQVQKNLEARRYKVKVFASAAEAADYLDAQIDGATVGLGGSGTLNAMGIYERLETHNTVFWHWKQPADEARRAAMQTQVYLTSANALAETGDWAKNRRREHGAAAAWSARADEVTRILGTTGLY